jgi:hypothetical protein
MASEPSGWAMLRSLSPDQAQGVQRRLAPFVKRAGNLNDPQDVGGVVTAGAVAPGPPIGPS